jgi:ATP-dependent Clp protease protease subunit
MTHRPATDPALPSPLAAGRKDDKEAGKDEGLGVARRLFDSRIIHVHGGVDDKLAQRVVGELLALDAADPEAPITLFLNSPGGSVTSGFAIYDIMRFIRPEIRVVCTGLTASIATIILQGATPGQRYTLPSTRLLIHQPLIPSTVFGPASDLEITAREIIKTRQRINKLLADATGQKLDKVEKDTQRDYWLTADESVAYGLVDGIVTELSALDAG